MIYWRHRHTVCSPLRVASSKNRAGHSVQPICDCPSWHRSTERSPARDCRLFERFLPGRTVSSSRPTCLTSMAVPLKVIVELRAVTKNHRNFDSAVMMFSAMPSCTAIKHSTAATTDGNSGRRPSLVVLTMRPPYLGSRLVRSGVRSTYREYRFRPCLSEPTTSANTMAASLRWVCSDIARV